jgi:hypothetical protein
VTTPNSSEAAHLSENSPPIDLRDPWLAAFLAWLVPGLGHMYQRRWGKGGLFMVCIMGTFFYGLWIGGGRVVYASFREPEFRDWRWAYVAQVANGLPALPAVVQAIRVSGPTPKAPLFDGFMAPPLRRGDVALKSWVHDQQAKYPKEAEFDQENFREAHRLPPEWANRYYAYIPPDSEFADQSSFWNLKHGGYYDLGTVFTVIAGLLNILAIWDAWGGPMIVVAKPKPEKEKTKKPGDANENSKGFEEAKAA